jgi:hypothetical protein
MKQLALFVLVLFVIPSAVAQSTRVTGIPQVDCPVVVEQQENLSDGSLKAADFKNFSSKTVDSIRIGWIASAERSGTSEPVLAMSTNLHPNLNPGGRVVLAPEQMGIHPSTTGRLKFYVASGHFSDGSRFVCSAKAMGSSDMASHVVKVRSAP